MGDLNEVERSDVLLAISNLVQHPQLSDEDAASKLLSSDFSKFRRSAVLKDVFNGRKVEFRQGGRIFLGGSGIVFECYAQVTGLPQRRYALKVVRPSLLANNMKDAGQVQENAKEEVDKNAALGHPNVANLIDARGFPLKLPNGPEIYCMATLLEWVDNALPLNLHVYRRCTDHASLVGVLSQFLTGLQHIHERELIHWDIKTANVLVDGSNTVKIMDVGNAKHRERPEDGWAEGDVAFTSKENCPAFLKRFLIESQTNPDSNRVRVVLPAGSPTPHIPQLDLYMSANMLSRIIGDIPESLPEFERERAKFHAALFPKGNEPAAEQGRFVLFGLRMIIQRLQSPGSIGALRGAFYSSADEVGATLARLLPPFGAADNIPELYPVAQHVLRIPVNGNTPYTARVNALINSTPLFRLTRHAQLGLTSHAYDGARHVRHEHLAGVMATALDYIRALYADKTSPIFRLLVSASDIRALLFASLIHDVGHGAFSHYLEEDVPLFGGVKHEAFAQVLLREREDEYESFGSHDSLAQDRQAIEAAARAGWLRDGGEPTPDASKVEVDRFLSRVADILSPPEYDRSASVRDVAGADLIILWILHSVLDSAIDADKLDYLRRDAVHAGVTYPGGIDSDRFFQALTTAVTPPSILDETGLPVAFSFTPTLAITEKGVLSVEGMLVGRYQLFTCLYWQHTARSVTVIVKTLVRDFLSASVGPKELLMRRATLLQVFRERDDRAAIKWLEEELCRGANAGKSDSVKRMCASLTERAELPESICELSFSSERGADAEELSAIISAHLRSLDRSPTEYVAELEDLHARLTSALLALVPKFKPKQKSALVFIDIPIESKDQVDNLYVVSQRSSQLHTSSFGGHSAMAEAISESFRRWARPVRVFVAPPLRRALLETYDEDELQRLVRGRLMEGQPESLQLEMDMGLLTIA